MPSQAELAGAVLHGDDFEAAQIAEWYRDEENAYAELYAENPEYEYEYEPFNKVNGFDFLPIRKFGHVVGMGSAYGDELRPIEFLVDRLTIIESADTYKKAPSLSVPTQWRKASITGDIDLPSGCADLVTCFGVLHHIPNVSHVLAEMGRITKSGGYALIREPVISMGDWSLPRAGLTPRERGIPARLLTRGCINAGFEVQQQIWCMFSPARIIGRRLNVELYNSRPLVKFDRVLSRLFVWNYTYHPANKWRKIRPTSLFLVLRKV